MIFNKKNDLLFNIILYNIFIIMETIAFSHIMDIAISRYIFLRKFLVNYKIKIYWDEHGKLSYKTFEECSKYERKHPIALHAFVQHVGHNDENLVKFIHSISEFIYDNSGHIPTEINII